MLPNLQREQKRKKVKGNAGHRKKRNKQGYEKSETKE
jgi:hypothetical protein